MGNCVLMGNGVRTNGDQIRALVAAPDHRLAEVLLQLSDMGELDDRIHFCRNLPVCEEIVDRDECVPSEMCLQCLVHWLGQPADKKVWGTEHAL